MYFTINDNKIVYAKYLINLEITDNIINNLSFCQFEKEGIIVYDDEKLLLIENKLKNLHIEYKINNLNQNIEKSVFLNINYKNYTEAYEHIINNIEPESLKKKRLEQENQSLKERLQQTEDALLTVMFGVK